LSQRAPQFLQRILDAGYQLSPEAYTYLIGLPAETSDTIAQKAIIKADAANPPLFLLDKPYLLALVETPRPEPLPQKNRQIPARDKGAPLKVLDEEPAQPASDAEGFLQYFQSRYDRLETILKRRVDVKDAVAIEQALRLPIKTKLKTIGIVNEKRTRGSKLFIELEDRRSTISVMATDDEVMRKGLELQEDQVIAVDAVKYTDDLLVANDWIWPDVPSNTPHRSPDPLYAALLSDVHVGSKYFRGDLFDKFIDWMNLELGPQQSRDVAARVKYVIVAGDLVDGVGIYPEQLTELTITDIREQYRVAAELLKRLPDYVDIVVIPGNHDATRHALPQPPIPKEYAKELYEDPRVKMLSTPCRVNLNGVEVLVEHGTGLNDILSSTPGYEFNHPLKAMELLFRCRHLAPRYGQSTPLAPERTDRLVISNIPDAFLMGHVHIGETKRYKGVTLVSAGSWQDQTPFQKRMQIEPTVGVATIFDLQTHQTLDLDFKRFQ
jgi:DNA polymerase II small subunit